MAVLRKKDQFFPAFNSWFDDFFADDMEFFGNRPTVPSVNIKEHKKDFVIELAAPGMKKENFSINIENNVLTISADIEENKEESKDKYTKREFFYSEFKRIFTLPETADIEKIDAEYKNGILQLTIDKKPEAQINQQKKIFIK